MKKFKIKLLPVMFVMAVLSVAASAAVIFNMMEKSGNSLLTSQPDVNVPNYVGMTEEEAKSDKDFSFETEYVYNADVEEGVVISQKPKAPRLVKENSTVKLKVSMGVLTSEIPELEMYTKAQAEAILSEMDVNVYIKKVADKELPEGIVKGTDPQAGQFVNSGDTVTVYVTGAEKSTTATVPNLIGKDIAEARRLIVGSRLKIHKVDVQNDQPAGTVVWQNHGAGAQLPIGTPLEIHVSNGEHD